MSKTFTAIALAVGIVAAPAFAGPTYDAFTTFNGTQGAGNFTYGYVDDAVTSGTLFADTTNCAIAGSVCLQQGSDVPGAYKSTVASFQYNSVNVPTDRLLLHPGPSASNGGVFITFTAPRAGNYAVSGVFNVQDISPSGVTIIFRRQLGAAPATFFGAGTLSSATPTFSYSGFAYLGAGDVLSTVINRAGFYGNDSTGENFALSLVPEPAAWGLMIAGFGLVGVAARRRRVALTA